MARDTFGWVGSVLEGKYRIESIVGDGGFGVVYAAQHLGFGRRVAVKCLKVPGHLDEAERRQFLEGFLAEGNLLHQLSQAHAGVVQALDIGAAESPNGAWTPYLVLEWLDGVTLEDDLADRARRGVAPRSLGETLALFEGAAGALATAHEQSVAHRDVKPANLFLAKVGSAVRTKVLDFGIAKVLTETTNLTRALAATGQSIRAFTPQYGAPEQFSPRFGATGTWTDVYAFALVLVEVLSGQAALVGADTTQLYIQSTDPGERPTPRTRGVAVSDAVEAVLARALEVQPRDRIHTLGEFWSALVAAAGGSIAPTALAQAHEGAPTAVVTALAPPPRMTAVAPGGSMAPPMGTTTTPAQVSIPPAPPSKKRGGKGPSGVAITVGLAVCAVGVGGAYWATRGEKSEVAGVASASTSSAASAASVVAVAPVPTCPAGMTAIPGGTFAMGADDGRPNEKPVHAVEVAGFCMDITEVTVGAYAKCVATGGCTVAQTTVDWTGITDAQRKWGVACNGNKPDRQEHPINCVDWNQADAYCRAGGRRLPTEEEWEYAARSGSEQRKYAWGDDAPGPKLVNAFGPEAATWAAQQGLGSFKPLYAESDGFPTTAPVGSFSRNRTAHGLLDVTGNVWEWTSSGYSADYSKNRSNDARVDRGGSWDNVVASNLRAALRGGLEPTYRSSDLGFRCAR